MLRSRLARALGNCALIAASLGAQAPAAIASDTPLSIERRWSVGGEGGWDYLVFYAPYLFISRATRVDIFDPRRGAVVASVPGTPGVHGVAIAPDLHLAFSSNGRGDSVSAFDLATFALVRQGSVSGHNPDAIVYDPAGKHLFTFNGTSKNVSVLDASSLAVQATLPVPDKPEFAVLDPFTGKIFGNIESQAGQMVVIDSRKLVVDAIWPLPGCSSPSGLAIDVANHRLFSACDDNVMVVTDALTGNPVARVPIGAGPDAVSFDPAHKRVLVSNGDGTLTVVRQRTSDQYEVTQTVPTQRGARTLALDPASGEVYLVSALFEEAPAPSPQHPHPRAILPGSFTILEVGPGKPSRAP